MFNLKNFLQAVGASILLTIVVSFLLGFINLGSYGVFLFVQTILTYGSIGYFSAKWNRETPYTAAYFGAILEAAVDKAGSVAPGIGTIIGAVAGLATGILITVGIEKTQVGRNAKRWVNDTLTKGYAYVGNGLKKGFNKVTSYSKDLFKSTKKLFGFG